METDVRAIRKYFQKLGLDSVFADLYLALHTHGPQTISELSRNSGVERTRIYRLVDNLIDSNLIEIESHYKKGVLKPAPISNLNILISKKEQELQSLQDELELIEQVLGRNSISSPATRVQFYRGQDGVKQMLWNETKSKTEVLSILHENIQFKTKSKFFERWVKKCNDSNIKFRSLVNESFLSSQKAWYAMHANERLNHWDARLIPPKAFPVHHGTIIYGEVVGYFNFKDSEVFGIEIYNEDIANTQRQFFEMLWESSTKIPDA